MTHAFHLLHLLLVHCRLVLRHGRRLLLLRCRLTLLQLLAPKPARTPADDRGQATTEYALVLLAAALVALLIVAWATAGGGAERIGGLFNAVIDSVIGRV